MHLVEAGDPEEIDVFLLEADARRALENRIATDRVI